MTDVGLEPTHPKIVELEPTPLDHSGNLSNPKKSESALYRDRTGDHCVISTALYH